MPHPSRLTRVRDIIHGFVYLDDQERDIINHPIFQRLRRIKQLSLTDMVYPGAVHTRFEHSLGVMQMASDMFESIVRNPDNYGRLQSNGYIESGIKRQLKIIRLAALLHDVGHGPFSHSSEELMPLLPKTHARYSPDIERRFDHEDYSRKLIKTAFKELIEDHDINSNYGIRCEDVTALLDDEAITPGKNLFWKALISGQVDADRCDYLLRDSRHLGVAYGLYDDKMLVNSLVLVEDQSGNLIVAVGGKGAYVAESLVIARYQMFTQVYFHKVRRIYDHHLTGAIRKVLKTSGRDDGCYPSPENLDDYVKLDDWTIQNSFKDGKGGEHGDRILRRDHYRCIFQTRVIPTEEEEQKILELCEEYKGKAYCLDDKANTSWYKLDKDITVTSGNRNTPLSELSSIVKAMSAKPVQKRFYIPKEGSR